MGSQGLEEVNGPKIKIGRNQLHVHGPGLTNFFTVLVTSLNKVKSNMTVPYIELLNCVPAKPTTDVGALLHRVC
jgi:hypothetical protein